ncbi:hypothetical protein GCM10011529_04080 [Polymorphobacter glacialis]|uniref:DUF4440 domain-containing protein n=1 Tax=Sandarakinorhabdus glacialis TaxID=1614636 RepID=A0A917E4U9_9SPHN|nr:hypothetical protein [Polymorphobacter glacialis]GGE00991.1 hypothetical protein GCM10011529_04080 [Polymorphobacter glacialis]
MIRRLAFALALAAAPAAAQNHHAEVAAALSAFMHSINTNDAGAFLAAQQPGTLIQIQRFKPDGSSNLEVFPAAEFAARMRARMGTAIDERLIDPQILVTRDFAHVWAPYSLDIDGKRSHCGVDSFGFVKTRGKWLINSLAWTADSTGCPK